ncbi:hypothetical protein BEN48_12720 [Hymenobacter glacialis]|uniref:Tc1-like transposase DDE domain-containing protein n=1 Tax=Hymenobacter glacialis TaxID=1908236 RepID=A0A1G1T6I2_9BACT|nr:hypothetical protein BEN48_12720 [Hymenobacter glacialis]
MGRHWRAPGCAGTGQIQAAIAVSGAVNSDIFIACLRQVLGLMLRPGDMAVLENQSAQQVAGLAGAVNACGPRLPYLPPSSPDCNFIKRAFSELENVAALAQVRLCRPLLAPPPTG